MDYQNNHLLQPKLAEIVIPYILKNKGSIGICGSMKNF